MGFSEKVQTDALLASGRCCCICHRFCGTKINLHHIVQRADGGDDSFENCIPLCLDCHEDMGKPDPHHSTGKHYSAKELVMHRDNWYSRVKQVNINTNTSVCEEDKALFKQLLGYFDDELCVVLKEYDFRGIIPASLFTKLDMIYRHTETPDTEFINIEMEMLRANLFDILYDFKCSLAQNTFSRYIGGQMYSVPRLWLLKEREIDLLPGKTFDEHYKMYEKEAQKLNDYADQLYEAYTTFVRQGRRITLR